MKTAISTLKGDIQIQIATVENAEKIFRLRLEALHLNPEAFAADFDLTLAKGAIAWPDIIREYNENASGAISIACDGDHVIGMAAIVRGHWPKTLHSGTLWGVYVTAEWRGYKIGASLVNHCIEWATEHQLSVVTLAVVIPNPAAIRCYEHCGFIEYGITPRALLQNNTYYDELMMYRFI